MGRKRSVHHNLPPRMYARKRGQKTWFYYRAGQRELPLGSEYGEAVRKWAEHEHGRTVPISDRVTVGTLLEEYARKVIPKKAERTQRDNHAEIGWLRKFFDVPPLMLDALRPMHVRMYVEWREGKVRATRELALLSHAWNYARRWGWTDAANPCEGIERPRSKGRTVYVEDDAYNALLKNACAPVREAIELAYLTGQRVADVLRMDQRDVRSGVLSVRQGKTDAHVPMEVTGKLAALLKRIATRKRGMVLHSTRLVVNEKGKPLSHSALTQRVRKLRAKLGMTHADFQMRDMRAKAGTDKAASGGMREAQQQLGHSSSAMTEHYVKLRRGQLVKPTR